MSATWQALIANLAVAALLATIWAQLSDRLEARHRLAREFITGVMVGTAAIVTMLMAVEVVGGIYFDLRACVIAIGAFFSGPLTAAIAVAIAGLYRLFEGGSGTVVGLFHLLAAALIGLAIRAVARSSLPRPHWVIVLSVAMAALVFATSSLLRSRMSADLLAEFMPPTAVLSFLATLMMGLTILTARRTSHERRVLRTALSQAPEFLYVKDTDSRFLTVNAAVAKHHGFDDPAHMVGLSDFDISPPDHAQRLIDQEQGIMRTLRPVLDQEETVTDSNGVQHWYRSSKVPLTDQDGRVIGLAGVTVDTTDLKRLEQELTQSRDRLSLAMSEMSDGLAVFDARGYLLFCNEQYQEAFPLSAHVRVPGAHIREILLECARTGEQLDIPRDDVEGWAERVGSLLRVPNVVTVELFDGRYVQLRNRPASNEAAVVIVTDVTDLKLAERALIEANADLSRQASTDALTGLPNRRVFDETLVRDMARCGRAGTPLSLILIDVDHFKRYNDTFGHQAGDKCLVMVAQAIKASLRRPSDLAARYGGEEFAVILPETNSEGAIEVAERIRNTITSASLAQMTAIGSRITASLGVAEYDLDKSPATPQDLIAHADAALYAAKAGGRNRVAADGVAGTDINVRTVKSGSS